MRRFLFAVALFALAPLASAEEISGAALVIDGDTLEIGGRRVRLHGIDAPELDQPCFDARGHEFACGRAADKTLKALVRGPVLCRGSEHDRYGRLVATCRAGGSDLNAAMVASGWALAFRDYSTDYVADEDEASRGRRGLWAGQFTAPWDYRKAVAARHYGKPIQTAGRACPIKGNISDNGRIYHRPGQKHYARTRIDETRGERWFCSEADARAAGWRPARR